ncbi:hypothetical protein HELRODRAFT_176239 [Helobdella robusta]|uniref:Uncharacterized protein n=1 Tax=Helobdella robusta TaxID=6412 RepID=T1FAB6_HELRO|nr:hypothetical protein HELRODRAFT_176239 [Helobdella robusta]ESN99941.1 hypothetical protein HELRODRAFT_176239 [Helobdella robusta]
MKYLFDGSNNDGTSKKVPNQFGSDLLVQCAEFALKTCSLDIAKDCLRMYHSCLPVEDVWMCRALICTIQMLPSLNVNCLDRANVLIDSTQKVLNIQKKRQKATPYAYNVCIMFARFCRPLLIPSHMKMLIKSFENVISFLDSYNGCDLAFKSLCRQSNSKDGQSVKVELNEIFNDLKPLTFKEIRWSDYNDDDNEEGHDVNDNIIANKGKEVNEDSTLYPVSDDVIGSLSALVIIIIIA